MAGLHVSKRYHLEAAERRAQFGNNWGEVWSEY